jgi:hypothetical protein
MPPDDPLPQRIDFAFLLNNNAVSFTQSARRHRIGRARVLSVLSATAYVDVSSPAEQGTRVLFVGRDWTGRLLEVIAVIEENQAVVIHAMDARPSVVRRYVEGTQRGTT